MVEGQEAALVQSFKVSQKVLYTSINAPKIIVWSLAPFEHSLYQCLYLRKIKNTIWSLHILLTQKTQKIPYMLRTSIMS